MEHLLYSIQIANEKEKSSLDHRIKNDMKIHRFKNNLTSYQMTPFLSMAFIIGSRELDFS